jgi:hypothetical protein
MVIHRLTFHVSNDDNIQPELGAQSAVRDSPKDTARFPRSFVAEGPARLSLPCIVALNRHPPGKEYTIAHVMALHKRFPAA